MNKDTMTSTNLIGKRVRFLRQRDIFDFGEVVSIELITNTSNDDRIVTGYAIALDSGEILHIAYWRVLEIITGKGKSNTIKHESKANNNFNKTQESEVKKKYVVEEVTDDDLPF